MQHTLKFITPLPVLPNPPDSRRSKTFPGIGPGRNPRVWCGWASPAVGPLTPLNDGGTVVPLHRAADRAHWRTCLARCMIIRHCERVAAQSYFIHWLVEQGPGTPWLGTHWRPPVFPGNSLVMSAWIGFSRHLIPTLSNPPKCNSRNSTSTMSRWLWNHAHLILMCIIMIKSKHI